MNNQRSFNKQPHPKKGACILSVLTYWWTLPIFMKGLRKDLEEDDLFEPLDEHVSGKLGDKLEESWIKEVRLYEKPSLLRALLRVFGLEFMSFGFVLIFIELVLKMSQPLALSQLLLHYSTSNKQKGQTEILIYASVIVGACFGYALLVHWYSLNLQHFGMKVRVACCSLIYRKSLRLSKTTTGVTRIGQMVNLLSNDVNRFDQAVVHIHSLWFVPIETTIIVYMLYRILGLISTIGIFVMMLFVPLQGKIIANLRSKTAIRTDYRIQLMNEIIGGIQVIKMYAWENQFGKLVKMARKLEIDQIRATSYIKGIMFSFTIINTRLAVFFSIVIYVMLGNDLKAEYVFVLISFYNVLRQAVTRSYIQGITRIGELSVSISRIQKFLLHEEVDSGEVGTETYRPLKTEWSCDFDNEKNAVGVSFKDASIKWSSNKVLSNINLHIGQNKLITVTGSVGSGKTSLLLAILKELPLNKGSIVVKGKVSYAPQEPWLFSGSIRQNILFGESLNEERYKNVINICELEKDCSAFHLGDQTVVGEKGMMLSGGQKARVNLARALYKEADIYLLDDPLSAVDAHVGTKLFENCISKFLRNKCVILVTHQLQYLCDFHEVFFMENGKLVKLAELQNSKIIDADRNKTGTTVYDKKNEQENVRTHFEIENQISPEEQEHRSFGKIANEVYIAYFRAGGSLAAAFFVVVMFVFTQLLASAADYFIAYWVDLESDRSNKNDLNVDDNPWYLPREACIYTYAVIIISTILVTLIRSFSFFKYCMEASKKLHNDMFSNIIHAKMIFFNTNTSGRILNRFSKDMGSIDETLPSVIVESIQIGLAAIGVTLVVSFVKPWFLAVTAAILTIFYGLRIIYLATSRNIKRLEAITRSPVFSHMNASLQGLTTIRAFEAQKLLQKEFDDLQDLHSSAWYLFLSCSRAFGFSLDMVCVIYVGIVTFSSLFIVNDQHGGNVGLAITQAISLTGLFQWGIRQWTELENLMTSVERVSEYTKIEQEVERTDIVLKKDWPWKGNIEFVAVSLRYSASDSNVLRNISIDIKSNEKIGIVGRTGAGKTSLVYALFQLAEIEGRILVDNIDITKVPLQTLRSQISIIPQEPFLFSGTLRKNLDPLEEYIDADLWNALAEVELKDVIACLPSGLEEQISEGGSNFSVGQRQLICLARAIIRHNKILIMDEATASLDVKTDTLIQATIRKKFADCTVLTIAHRLHTVMDSDKILVMDNGCVVEFDRPEVLLKDVDSLFYSMVYQNGYPLLAKNGAKTTGIEK